MAGCGEGERATGRGHNPQNWEKGLVVALGVSGVSWGGGRRGGRECVLLMGSAAHMGGSRCWPHARFWGIPKVLLCLQRGTFPPEGTSPQVTRVVPARSIPTSSVVPTSLLQPPNSCSALGGLSPRHLRAPISPSATWPQPPCLGGQNQFAKHTQSLKSHWQQAGGHVTVVQVT